MAQAIWIDDNPEPGHDQWMTFRRSFASDGTPGEIMLFAESRYALSVDGRPIFHGPIRFVPGLERFDRVPLDLSPGEHAIKVLVRRQVVNNFQNLPDPRGGFIAWGSVGGINLGTSGDWQVSTSTGQHDGAPACTFALGPGEWRDTSRRVADWRAPIVVDRPGWDTMAERDVPPTDGRVLRLKLDRTIHVSEAARRSVCVLPAAPLDPRRTLAIRGYVHAEQPTTLAFEHGWGDWHVNDKPLAARPNPHNERQITTIALEAGWNEIRGDVAVPGTRPSVMVGLPRDVVVRQAPRDDATTGWARAARLPIEVPDALAIWKRFDTDTPAPARQLSWAVTTDEPGHLRCYEADTAFLGHLVVTVDDDPACDGVDPVDVGFGEHRKVSGAIDYFRTNPLTETADHYAVDGGAHELVGFEPRGGRFVEVLTRRGLKGAAVRSASCMPPVTVTLDTGDDLFDWVWQTAITTARACTEDTFIDCPWRERALYIGDGWLQSRLHHVLTGDTTIPARCLRLFAHARRDDGQLPCCVPSHLRVPHCDYTLIYPLWLLEHFDRTGDGELVQECWPAVEAIWTSPTWQASASGLWNAPADLRPFVDWAADDDTRLADENGVLNAYRIAALAATARLAEVLEHAGDWQEQADRLTDVYRDRLWRGDGCAAGYRDGNRLGPSPHVDTLVLKFGLAPPGEEATLLAVEKAHVERNVDRALHGERHGGFLELFFLSHAFDALLDRGEEEAVRQAIRSHYRPMRDAGAWAFWETLHGGSRGLGSLCHAWSGAGALALWRMHVAHTQAHGLQSVGLSVKSVL